MYRDVQVSREGRIPGVTEAGCGAPTDVIRITPAVNSGISMEISSYPVNHAGKPVFRK
jgi:hypothetical protein